MCKIIQLTHYICGHTIEIQKISTCDAQKSRRFDSLCQQYLQGTIRSRFLKGGDYHLAPEEDGIMYEWYEANPCHISPIPEYKYVEAKCPDCYIDAMRLRQDKKFEEEDWKREKDVWDIAFKIMAEMKKEEGRGRVYVPYHSVGDGEGGYQNPSDRQKDSDAGRSSNHSPAPRESHGIYDEDLRDRLRDLRPYGPMGCCVM